MDGLTALERELLSCVERLTRASEASAQELKSSGSEMRTELDGLHGSMIALARSQILLVKALSDWMQEASGIETTPSKLQDSLKLAQRAQAQQGKP